MFGECNLCVTLLLFWCCVSSGGAEPDGCPSIVPRREWNALPPKTVKRLREFPAPYVVVHHSASEVCTTKDSCKNYVKGVQRYHMDTRKWEDIGYNFLIGGEGTIYEGRGWGVHGAHAPTHNARSIGVCFIGNFQRTKPRDVQMESLKKLLDCGYQTGQISEDYRIVGHRQTKSTQCPGDELFDVIKTLPHFYDGPM